MPRNPSPFQRCITGYVDYMTTEAMYADKTIDEYRWAIIRCHDIVRVGQGPENPERVSRENLEYLLENMTGRVANRKFNWTAYAGFLKWCGNDAIHDKKPKWPNEQRMKVDWLTEEEAYAVRETAMGMDPLSALIVHLELDLCLRRIEIMRLTTSSIHDNGIDVLGKGRMGGKLRRVSLVAGESEAIIGRYMEHRAELERKATGPRTDKLVVHLWHGTLKPYCRCALDKRLKNIQVASGVSFLGHHTLRRTAGRLMWLAKMPIETIASVMGHASTDMTLLYIGVNLDDQAKAFDAVRNMRIQSQKTAKIVPSLDMPVASGGPNRI